MTLSSPKPYLFIVTIAILLLSNAAPVRAIKPTTDLFSLSLEALMEVEITGSTLTPQKINIAPSPVTVFNHHQLQNMGLDTLTEVMNLVPGFQSYRSGQSPLHHPFSSRGRRIGGTSAEVLILMDGQRLNESRTDGANSIVPNMPITNIERVEFIRGPGAAIYGSNAMMGVINIITRSQANEANLGYGSNNRKHISLLTNNKVSEIEVDFFAQVEQSRGEEFLVQDTFSQEQTTTRDPYKTTDLNLKIKWQKTQLNIHHNSNDADDFYMLNRISNGFNQYYSDLSYITLKQSFNWQSISSGVQLSYSQSTLELHTQLSLPGGLADISSPSSNDPLRAHIIFEDREVKVQWHNDWKINSNSHLQFGTELRSITIPEAYAINNYDMAAIANENFPVQFYDQEYATTPIQQSSQRNIAGLYGQYQTTPTNNGHLTLGIRYDKYSRVGGQVSPRLGWVQELGACQSIKILYGKAFRAPSENELNLVNNGVLLGNPNLEPETVKSVDIIWLGNWPTVNTSIGYFESHFNNAIAQALVNGAIQYTNISSEDHTRGLEFEASHEITKNILLRGAYTRVLSKPKESFREANSFGSMTMDFHQGKWNANLIARYHGNSEMLTTTNPKTLDSYWQLSSKIRYSISEKWEGFFKVKNALDATITTPPSFANGQEGTPSHGREVVIGASINW